MKNLLIVIFLLVGFNLFGQPPGYTKRNIRENVISFIVDSTFHVPRYNGTPSGVRSGGYVADGAIAIDTTNHRGYIYSGGAWVRMANFSELSTYVAVADSAAMLANYLRGATEGFGIDISGSQHKTWAADSTSGGVLSWVRGKKIADSLGVLITAISTPTLNQVANNGSIRSWSSSGMGITLSGTGADASSAALQIGQGVNGLPIYITNQNFSPLHQNKEWNALHFERDVVGGATADGLAIKHTYSLETSSSADTSTKVVTGWKVSNHTNRTAFYDIRLVDSGTLKTAMRLEPDYIIVNNGADTLARMSYVRDTETGGGGGVSSANLPLRISGSTVSADTSVAYDPSLTTNKRLQKVTDSLLAILNIVNNPKDIYQYYYDISGSTTANMYGPTAVGAGSSIARAVPSYDNWMGQIELNVGTTTTGFVYWHFGNVGLVGGVNISSSYRYNYATKLRLEDLSDGTDSYRVIAGYMDHNNSEASIVDGIWFSYIHSASSGQWVCNTRSNSSTTSTASGITVAADTDYYLQISVYGGEAKFYINGTLVHTETSTLPDDDVARSTGMCQSISKTAGTNNRKMYVEEIKYGKVNF